MMNRLLLLFFSVAFAVSVFAAEIPVRTGQTIAFLGDSITEQGAGSPSGYVNLVISGFKSNGIDVTAIPAGKSGHKSNDMLARLEKDVLLKKPDWMTLSCGVNDVWHSERGNGVSLEDYQKNITAIVDRAQAQGIQVMILTATLIKEDPQAPLNRMAEPYNEFLRNLAREKNCLLADLNQVEREGLKAAEAGPGRAGNIYTTDGVHMNPYGNQMISAAMLAAFGFSEEQLKAARAAWMEMPNAVTIGARKQMTLDQYEKLQTKAKAQNQSLEDYLNDLFNKALESSP